MITIHTHPRAAELFAVVSGQVYTEAVPESFVLDSQNKPRVIRNEIGAGEATVFYQGAMHYQINTDCDPTVALAAFSSEDAGFTGVAAGLFSVKDDALVNTFGEVIAGEDIDKFREGISKQAGMKVDQCLKKCGKQKRQFWVLAGRCWSVWCFSLPVSLFFFLIFYIPYLEYRINFFDHN